MTSTTLVRPRNLAELRESVIGLSTQTVAESQEVTVLADKTIYHKNLRPVAYVFADTAGRAPAEVIADVLADRRPVEVGASRSRTLDERTYLAPGGGDLWSLPSEVHAVWDGEGEWQITLKVFRDLGIAFGAVLVLIYNPQSLMTPADYANGTVLDDRSTGTGRSRCTRRWAPRRRRGRSIL